MAKKEVERNREEESSGLSAVSSDKEFKVAKVREVESSLAYRRELERHYKSKGKRSYPSPLTAPSSKKARAVS